MPDSITVQDLSANPAPNLADRVRRAALDHDGRPALRWRDGVVVPDDDPDELNIPDVAPGTDPGQIVVAGPNLSPVTGRPVGAARTPTAGGAPPTPTVTCSWSTGSAS